MPSWELFEAQDPAYQDSVLPKVTAKRLSVEAGTSFGWQKYIGTDGAAVSIDRFGASAPGGVCLEKFGFSVDNVVARAKELIG
jgi:transketolase